MFARIEPDGVRWADGEFAPADAIIWATGFRPSLTHLAPLRLREDTGGIRLIAREDAHTPTTAARDHRVQLVGYGPSASTIGANRAGRVAALSVLRTLAEAAPTASGSRRLAELVLEVDRPRDREPRQQEGHRQRRSARAAAPSSRR